MKNFKGKRMVDEDLIQKLKDLQPGGGEYTAGDGIDITDNEISIDDTVVATKEDLAEVIEVTSATGTLSDDDFAKVKLGTILKYVNSTDNITKIYTVVSENSDGFYLENSGGSRDYMDSTNNRFISKKDHGEITKSTKAYSLNGSSTNVFELNSTMAYSSVENTIGVNTTVVALKTDIPTTATSTSSVTPSTVQLTFTYSDNTTETITLMTGASVSTTTTLS